MDNWFSALAAEMHLSPSVIDDTRKDGFVVIPGPVPKTKLAGLANSYDQAVLQADSDDIAVGNTTTRVTDFVNRYAEFDDLYVHLPVLEACCRIIEQPFKLSTMHARTLRPRMPPQKLHVDMASDAEGWPLVGFIFMIDEFRPNNGATCFIPGSQGAKTLPAAFNIVSACGPAGSMIVFNGSVWHGHGANETDEPRRSIQGAFIRRTEKSGLDLPARMRPETLDRLGSLAKYLLTLESHPEGIMHRGIPLESA
jgi:ectoine hydroxylase-related dioxygenase (phytanoyl-CoA dioxygenase family)